MSAVVERGSRSTVAAVIVATTIAQIASTMGVAVFPVIAPELAAELALDPSLIGYQVSLIYGVAMVGSPFLNLMIPKWGACRTTQVGLAFAAGSMLLALVPNIVALIAASMLLGLSLSVMTPASAHLLFRFSPPENRNFIFSLKQTGVPLAWVVMALVAPGVTLAFGWRWSLVVVCAAAAVTLVAMERVRERWDDDRDPRSAAIQNPFAGLTVLWRHPVLRRLAMSGLCLTFVQLCLGTFTVVMLVEEAHYSLVAAGFVLSLVQAAGAAGRILWGWMGDRTGDSLRVLIVMTVMASACSLVTALVSPQWPAAAVAVLFIVFGASAVGWNGVYLAEIARRSPRGQIGAAAGGAVAWTFCGILIGPAAFTTAYKGAGSYAYTFGLLALVSGAALALLIAAAQIARREVRAN